jgi:hypothetical protein
VGGDVRVIVPVHRDPTLDPQLLGESEVVEMAVGQHHRAHVVDAPAEAAQRVDELPPRARQPCIDEEQVPPSSTR